MGGCAVFWPDVMNYINCTNVTLQLPRSKQKTVRTVIKLSQTGDISHWVFVLPSSLTAQNTLWKLAGGFQEIQRRCVRVWGETFIEKCLYRGPNLSHWSEGYGHWLPSLSGCAAKWKATRAGLFPASLCSDFSDTSISAPGRRATHKQRYRSPTQTHTYTHTERGKKAHDLTTARHTRTRVRFHPQQYKNNIVQT